MAARTSGVCLGQQQKAEEVGHVETVTGMEGVGHGQMEKAQAGLAVLQAQVVLAVLQAQVVLDVLQAQAVPAVLQAQVVPAVHAAQVVLVVHAVQAGLAVLLGQVVLAVHAAQVVPGVHAGQAVLGVLQGRRVVGVGHLNMYTRKGECHERSATDWHGDRTSRGSPRRGWRRPWSTCSTTTWAWAA